MVKVNYTPLKELNDQSKNFKVKVKVISKLDPKQTPPKRRYQKLLLEDDEGIAMDATIFENDIEVFEQALEKNGEYELSNVTVKPVPASYRDRAVGDYQLNFNSNVRIIPLDLSGCSNEPQYRTLDKIPRTHSLEDEMIDVVGVVLFIGVVRTIKRDETEDKVRDIIIADQSVTRPVKVSAWNRSAECDSPFFNTWSEGFTVVGFRGVQPLTYRGFSLKTGQSTEFVENPNSEIADALRSWTENNIQVLEDWRDKAIQIYSESGDKKPKFLNDMARKKANTIWPDEKFWIQGSMSALEAKEINCYTGCSKCNKKSADRVRTKFVCSHCHAEDAATLKRVLLSVTISDDTGSLKVSAFMNEVELMVGLKVEQIAQLKENENSEELEKKISELRKKQMLLQIAPTKELFISNMLKWIVRAVEVPAEEEP